MDEQPYAVLVPYYSNPEYLRLALESVVAQSDPNWWCVVVDDSPDGGAAAVVSAVGDARVRHVRNSTNLGVAGNFNRCFELAREQALGLAVILHADDELEPWYVGTVVAAHAADPIAACVIPRVRIVGADGSPARTLADTVKTVMWPRRAERLSGEAGLRRLLHGQFFHCPAVSYRLALLPDHAWNDRWRQVMDLELYAGMLLDGQHFGLERRVCFRYRRHRGQQTEANSIDLRRTSEESTLCDELAERAAAQGWSSAARAGRWRVAVRLQAIVRAGSLAVHGQVAAARASLGMALRRRTTAG